MTIVATWINYENELSPALWTITDSRLSVPKASSSGTKPQLDCGAKLFSLRVICKKADIHGFFNEVYYSTTIGMAFSGSSLLALNLYAFLSYTLGNLSSGDETVPSLENFAQHAYVAFKNLLANYIDLNFQSTPCEVSIFGMCPKLSKYKLFHIKHLAVDKNSTFNEVDLTNNKVVHLMGESIEEIRESINQYRVENKDKSQRAPKFVIEEIISTKKYEGIGGGLQLGIASLEGFKLFSICKPTIQGQPESTFIYQNIDFYSDPQLTNIGNCFIGIEAMA